MTAALGRAATLDRGWGGEPPKRFTISVADAVLSDLQRRLEATRWPDEISGSRWLYGTDLQYLKNLVDYWRKGYAWRDQEATLKSAPPFHGRDRRHRSSLYSQTRGRQRTVSTVVDPRLAGLDRRIPEAASDADTSFSIRRQCARCVHRCCALYSRLWLLIPSQPASLRPARNCRYLQPFNDGGAGISQVRRPRPRLGRVRRYAARIRPRRQTYRNSHNPARHPAGAARSTPANRGRRSVLRTARSLA